MNSPSKHMLTRFKRWPEFAAACLGLLIALTYFNLDYITGTANWLSFGGDRLQHVSGGNYFVQDEWHFPLLDMKNVNTPEGANLAMMDGIPIAGIVCKLFVAPFHPGPFNYIGYWLVFCFMMQGWFAVRLMRALGHSHWPILLLAALFALSYPPFIFRFGHASLTGHFLLLWALALYVEGTKRGYPLSQHIRFALLASLTVMVHIYLMAMVMVIYLGFTLQQVWKMRYWRGLVCYGGSALAVLGLMFVLGILRLGEPVQVIGGYGVYSMNLISPFWPQWSGLFRSFNLPYIDPTNGQYEGYAYLGLGVILLFVSSIIAWPKHWLRMAKSHRWLLLLLLCLLCFVISHRVYFANWKLCTLPIPVGRTLCEHFRASGRFIWPIGYLVIFVSLHLMVVHLRRAVAIGLLLPLGLIQHVDSQGAPLLASRNLRAVSDQESAYWKEISQIVGRHQHIDLFPYFGCGVAETNESLHKYQYLASFHNVTINTAYLARNKKPCTAMEADLSVLSLGQDNLIVLLKPVYNYLNAIQIAGDDRYIRESQEAFLISRQWVTIPSSKNIHRSLNPSALGDAESGWTVQLDKENYSKQSVASFQKGFSRPESWGTWTESSEASILIDPRLLPDQGYRLYFTWHAFISDKHPTQSVQCMINGKVIGAWTYSWPDDTGLQSATITITDTQSISGQLLNLRFLFPDAVSPQQLGQGNDTRTLSIGFRKIAMEPLAQ